MTVENSPKPPNGQFEVALTRLMIAITVVAALLFTRDLVAIVVGALQRGHYGVVATYGVFTLVMYFLVFGNLVYQFARIGHFTRLVLHRPAPSPTLEAFTYRGAPPTLTILIPSYREDLRIIKQTLLSAALQEYPARRVVLLIDDPYAPARAADRRHLAATRQLVRQVDELLAVPAARLEGAGREYLARKRAGRAVPEVELAQLANHYDEVARWFADFRQSCEVDDHTDRFFVERILGEPERAHRRRAADLRALPGRGVVPAECLIDQEYRRLAGLFRVPLSSFERKKYANLSHEPNKAMNLNSYIALFGGRFSERATGDGHVLEPAGDGGCTLAVPPTDYVITLDADSLLLPGYALRLVHAMEQPAHARTGVIQTPYTAIPHAPHVLERVAGATTDIQFLIHQGFTHYNATFWVGANALLRKAALDDIRVVEQEGALRVAKYIQDRTVIEDTESTIDLIRRGWHLHNFPERLAYSATPPDFGALLIQRRRWANGGLIILPKLLRYLVARPRHRGKVAEGLMRFHYLASVGGVSVGLLLVLALPLDARLPSPWLPVTALPYYLLYGRDLRHLGYRLGDLLRVYAVNLMLIPINLGGVAQSLRQAVTGAKIPFGRTPKVQGRTAAPLSYLAAEYALMLYFAQACLVDAVSGHWGTALFTAANLGVCGYILACLIGLRASAEDAMAQHGFAQRVRRAGAALALCMTALRRHAPDASPHAPESTAVD